MEKLSPSFCSDSTKINPIKLLHLSNAGQVPQHNLSSLYLSSGLVGLLGLNLPTVLGHLKLFFTCAVAETAAVNKLQDSHAGGDIYSCKHSLRTSVAFQKWRKKFFKCNKEVA